MLSITTISAPAFALAASRIQDHPAVAALITLAGTIRIPGLNLICQPDPD